jgi:hypothetical protein
MQRPGNARSMLDRFDRDPGGLLYLVIIDRGFLRRPTA